MASRGGRIRISIEGDSSDLSRSVDSANRSLGGLKKGSSVGSRALRGVGTAAKVAGAAVAALAVIELPRMIDEAREAQKVGAQTNAVLKSTGGVANITADGVADLANQISLKTAIDDEQIQSAENMLLTFQNIRNETGRGNDVFNQATQAVTDMSVAMGTDMKSASIQLGKALNDPIAGLSSLGRVGVQFDEQTKARIQGLVEQGDTLKAQKIILAELSKEFGGSAASQATDADKLTVAWANLEETLGTALIPVLDDAARAIIQFMAEWRKGIGLGGAVKGTFVAIGTAIDVSVSAVQTAARSAWPVLQAAMKGTAVAANAVWVALKATGGAFAAAGRWVADAAKNVAGFVAALWPVKTAAVGVYVTLKLLKTGLSLVWDVAKNLAPLFGSIIVRALDVAGAAFKAIWPIIRGLAQIVADVIGILTNLFRGDFKGAFQNAVDVVKHTTGAIKDTVVAVFKLIVSVIKNAVGLARDAVKAAWGVIRDVTKTLFGITADVVKAAIGKVVDFIRGGIDRARDAAKAIGDAVVSGVGQAKQIVSDVGGWIRDLPGKIRDAATAVYSAAAGLAQKVVSGFMSVLKGIGTLILQAFKGPINTIISKWNALSLRIDPGSIDIPDSIPGLPDSFDIPGLTLNTPDIPLLARGAVLDGATLAVVGEAGREYVIPVENNQDQGRALLMDAAAELGVPLLADGARPKASLAALAGKGGKGGKGGGSGAKHEDTDLSDVTEASGRLNQLLAAHAAALRDMTGLSALWAPHKPGWADPAKYTAVDGTYDDLETANDLLDYWNNQVAKYQSPQQVKVGEKWKTYKKDVTKGKGKKKKIVHHKGDEIPGSRQPVYWTGILYDQLENALNESAGWADFIAGLFDPLDGTSGTGSGSSETQTEALQQVLDATTAINEALVRELAIRNAQDPVLANFLGSFDKGGVVPGPKGAPGLALVHGKETILPTHKSDAGPIEVRIIGDPSLPSMIDRIEIAAAGAVQTVGAKVGLGMQSPSAPGVRARFRNTRRPGSNRR